jgi:peroxiredoxin
MVAALLVLVVTGASLAFGQKTFGEKKEAAQSAGETLVADKPAPAFALTSVDGKKLNLADYKGKAVIVNFWATWCPPCKAEIPDMVELQNQYGGDKFSFIGIAVNDKEDKVKAFIAEKKITYPVAMGDEQVMMAYQSLLPPNLRGGIPCTFVIDAKGNVAEFFVGIKGKTEFEEAIKKVMAAKK